MIKSVVTAPGGTYGAVYLREVRNVNPHPAYVTFVTCHNYTDNVAPDQPAHTHSLTRDLNSLLISQCQHILQIS